MHRQSEIKMARLSFRSHFHRDPDLSTGRAGNKGNSAVKKNKSQRFGPSGDRSSHWRFFLFLFFFKDPHLAFVSHCSRIHLSLISLLLGRRKHLQPALLWIFALLGDDVRGWDMKNAWAVCICLSWVMQLWWNSGGLFSFFFLFLFQLPNVSLATSWLKQRNREKKKLTLQ